MVRRILLYFVEKRMRSLHRKLMSQLGFVSWDSIKALSSAKRHFTDFNIAWYAGDTHLMQKHCTAQMAQDSCSLQRLAGIRSRFSGAAQFDILEFLLVDVVLNAVELGEDVCQCHKDLSGCLSVAVKLSFGAGVDARTDVGWEIWDFIWDHKSWKCHRVMPLIE